MCCSMYKSLILLYTLTVLKGGGVGRRSADWLFRK